ncbi:uncharacterized protein LOC116265908 isoform X1 [Nymphaea colorata]|nr:uncharacterized protein LOC116265908 isoform X1 [Nymphaea colorata]
MRSALLRRLLLGSARQAPSPSHAPRSTVPWAFNATRTAVSAAVADEESECVVFPREGPGVSYGLNWALAGRGVIVKEKAFHNLKSYDLHKNGAAAVDSVKGVPVFVRGSFCKEDKEITKAQFGKLLKQVTAHISSVSNVFVHDGGIGSSSKSDAKVRVISDHASADLMFSNILWRVPTRAISHDSCPVTVYVASSISPAAGELLGLGSQPNAGFIAADFDRSSLILCGKAFADNSGVKDALAALAAPTVFARGGLPLSARLLVVGDSVVLLFGSKDTIQNCTELHKLMVAKDEGVVLSSHGVAPLFRTKDATAPNLYKQPASVIITSADPSGVLPSISKLSPGQAAYHFLAGYQSGKFMPAYHDQFLSLDPLELAKRLSTQLQNSEIPSYLINVSEGEKHVAGKELLKLVESTLSKGARPSGQRKASDSVAAELQTKYKDYISSKYPELPEELAF